MSDEDGLGSMTPTPPSARRRSMVPLLVLILLAFVVGVGVTIWAWPQIQSRMDEPQPQAASMAPPQASTVPRTLTQRSLSIDAAQMLDARVGLIDIGERATTPPANASWWSALEHEARELVTIRRASSPSPRPQAGFDRAIHYLDGGRVNAALAEVERLPGRAAADRWIQLARRYLEARRALDLIETAAILEPRVLRSAEGAPVAQTSPLAP